MPRVALPRKSESWGKMRTFRAGAYFLDKSWVFALFAGLLRYERAAMARLTTKQSPIGRPSGLNMILGSFGGCQALFGSNQISGKPVLRPGETKTFGKATDKR